MKVHYLAAVNKFKCGKRPAGILMHTGNPEEITCKSCKESYLYDKGAIKEYRVGGNFDKDGNERSNRGQRYQ